MEQNALLIIVCAAGIMLTLQTLLVFVRTSRFSLAEGLYALLYVAFLAYFLQPLATLFSFGGMIFGLLNALIPLLFLLLAAALFNDRFRLRVWMLLPVALYLFLQQWVISPLIGENSVMMLLRKWFVLGLDIALMLFALWLVMRDWHQDLVEARRHLRHRIAVAVGGAILLVIGIGQLFSLPHLVQYLVALVVLVGFNVSLLTHKRDLFESVVSASSQLPTQLKELGREDVSESELKVIADAMQAKRYQQEGLTIGQLSQHLQMKEYRLRQIINQGMGYKNFSDFLNHYRIEEAKHLLQRQDCDLSITDIASGVGYSSLSSFNKAFKQIADCTPSVYRKQHST